VAQPFDPTPLLRVAKELRQTRIDCAQIASELRGLVYGLDWRGDDRTELLKEADSVIAYLNGLSSTADGGRRVVQNAANELAAGGI
jgi:hypothetical protein